MSAFLDRMSKLSAAEEFFRALEVPFDSPVLHVNRLHILQRYRDYLSRETAPADDAALAARHREALARAYADFTRSTAAKEKVFKVFKDADAAGKPAFVGLDAIAPVN